MSKLLPKLSHVVAATAVAVAAFAAQAVADNHAMTASAKMLNPDGQEVGTVSLRQTAAGVLLEAEISGLQPGEHGFHIHETGQCDTPEFKSAGGHYNPDGVEHGFLSEGGGHAGDMPNQFVGDDGVLRAGVLNPDVTLGEGGASLFDDDGSAIVVHAGADDYRSQPSGDAGSRAACGVIEPSGA